MDFERIAQGRSNGGFEAAQIVHGFGSQDNLEGHSRPRLSAKEKCRLGYRGGGGASTSRLPTWLAALTTPSASMRSISLAARL
jgi:hypothetical protein